jgi:hypothetical protein
VGSLKPVPIPKERTGFRSVMKVCSVALGDFMVHLVDYGQFQESLKSSSVFLCFQLFLGFIPELSQAEFK